MQFNFSKLPTGRCRLDNTHTPDNTKNQVINGNVPNNRDQIEKKEKERGIPFVNLTQKSTPKTFIIVYHLMWF